MVPMGTMLVILSIACLEMVRTFIWMTEERDILLIALSGMVRTSMVMMVRRDFQLILPLEEDLISFLMEMTN